jgi:hypothetical protein
MDRLSAAAVDCGLGPASAHAILDFLACIHHLALAPAGQERKKKK